MEEKTIKSVSPLPYGLIMGAISGILAFIVDILLVLFYLPVVASV